MMESLLFIAFSRARPHLLITLCHARPQRLITHRLNNVFAGRREAFGVCRLAGEKRRRRPGGKVLVVVLLLDPLLLWLLRLLLVDALGDVAAAFVGP